MNILEASKYLPTGIKRKGWRGCIKSKRTGKIVFCCYGEELDWSPYQQDIEADDWEVANDGE